MNLIRLQLKWLHFTLFDDNSIIFIWLYTFFVYSIFNFNRLSILKVSLPIWYLNHFKWIYLHIWIFLSSLLSYYRCRTWRAVFWNFLASRIWRISKAIKDIFSDQISNTKIESMISPSRCDPCNGSPLFPLIVFHEFNWLQSHVFYSYEINGRFHHFERWKMKLTFRSRNHFQRYI